MSELKSITTKSKSSKKDKKEKRVEVEEIENGYLITTITEWSDKEGWHSERKKYYSENYPFDAGEKELADYF